MAAAQVVRMLSSSGFYAQRLEWFPGLLLNSGLIEDDHGTSRERALP
jgi:hypothetical protein